MALPAATGPLLAAVGCIALASRAARAERVSNGDAAFGVVAGLLLALVSGSLGTALATAAAGALAWPVLLLLLEMEDVRLMPALGALLFEPVRLPGLSAPAFVPAALYLLLSAMALDTLAQRDVYLPAVTVLKGGTPDFPNFVNLPAVAAAGCLALALIV
jgi:hypothetical protein